MFLWTIPSALWISKGNSFQHVILTIWCRLPWSFSILNIDKYTLITKSCRFYNHHSTCTEGYMSLNVFMLYCRPVSNQLKLTFSRYQKRTMLWTRGAALHLYVKRLVLFTCSWIRTATVVDKEAIAMLKPTFILEVALNEFGTLPVLEPGHNLPSHIG